MLSLFKSLHVKLGGSQNEGAQNISRILDKIAVNSIHVSLLDIAFYLTADHCYELSGLNVVLRYSSLKFRWSKIPTCHQISLDDHYSP